MHSRLKDLIRWFPFLKILLIGCEFVIKRALATLLWLAWRSRLHPFLFLRGKGYTPGRYYIELFIKDHAATCSGRFLEFGDPYYRAFFNPASIEAYDIIDVDPGPDVSIVADIQRCEVIPENSYDVIICTQVLEHVANPFLAVAELYRILKPGGRLLVTVPAAYPYHAIPRDYWRFTPDSLQLLFGDLFEEVSIKGYGNRLTVVAAYWFWMKDHLPRRALLENDPNSPALLALSARKGEAKLSVQGRR